MPDAQKLLMLIDLLNSKPKFQKELQEMFMTLVLTFKFGTLEEHYGGLNRAKKDVLHKLETFPKINKFNKDNEWEFSSLLLNI
jgi:hypothetical protein